jgi:RNA polymerase sigma-70 factor, ECF subfamily
MRRESLRRAKEDAAATSTAAGGAGARVDDDLWLICLCCHPALSAPSRIALTLRAVCGLTTAEIAAGFLVTEATMAKRLARAKTKVRESGMALADPRAELPRERTTDVLKVIYLIFSEGHRATSGAELVRADLCMAATNLARALAALAPGDPEVLGLLALLLPTDARRPARAGADGTPVLLEEQDRSLWNAEMVEEGEQILIGALKLGQPGPYQLQAAIAACHSTARRAAATDWRQISVLYSELLRFDPSPVIEANRAIAVAMAEGPAAGLTILDVVVADARLKELAGHPPGQSRPSPASRAGRGREERLPNRTRTRAARSRAPLHRQPAWRPLSHPAVRRLPRRRRVYRQGTSAA